MPDFVTLSCPSCGGKLKITSDIDRFACMYCGAEHVVRRGEGIIALAPVVEGLAKVQIGVDKTASELAIQRLTAEITKLSNQIATAKNDVTINASSIASGNNQIAQLKTNLSHLEKGPENLENRLAQIVKPKLVFLVGPILGSLVGIGVFNALMRETWVFIITLILPFGIVGIAILVNLIEYSQFV